MVYLFFMMPSFRPTIRAQRFLRVFALSALLAGWAGSAGAEKTQTYLFDIQKVDGHFPLTLLVEPKEGYTLVSYHNEFNDYEISAFNPDLQILYAQYFDPQHHETATVTYDYDLKLITLKGIHDATYRLADRAFENNGSLFYLFGKLQPEPGKDVIFSLTQGNLSHIEDPFQRFLISKLVGPVEMALRYKDTEVLELGGNTRAARHFELGINDSRLAVFWPKRYHFWYSTDTPSVLLRYQGINPKNQIELITFVGQSEQETPREPLIDIDLKR